MLSSVYNYQLFRSSPYTSIQFLEKATLTKLESNRNFFPISAPVTNPIETDYALVQRIRACTEQGWISYAQQHHCRVLQSGLLSNVFVSTSLVGFYARCVSLTDAHRLFVEIPTRNVVTWNTMICGYLHSGNASTALSFFYRLCRTELRPDAFSCTAALAAVGQLRFLPLGSAIHAQIVKGGMESPSAAAAAVVVGNCLIDVYGRCGAVDEAVDVFNGLADKDVISWNSVVSACLRNCRIDLAFQYFHSMPYRDTISYNELISGLVQFGNMEDAVRILESMPQPSSSSWNSIITGYVNCNRAGEALDMLRAMHVSGVEMDEYTFSSSLSGIARLSVLTWGMVLHSLAVKHGLDASVVVGSAFIDMYSKCGQVNLAELVFESLPHKNTVTWNAMISGFAHNGEPEKAMQHFEELKRARDLKPDEITFLNVLAACSHNLMRFETAHRCFTLMVKDNEIVPTVEHMTSMIRLMGQQGEVWRAEKMIDEFGFGSCGLVWRALLGACRTSGDLKVARVAAAKVIELEGDDEFAYVVLSNINAEHGRWDESGEVREMMRNKGVEKEAGFSWIRM